MAYYQRLALGGFLAASLGIAAHAACTKPKYSSAHLKPINVKSVNQSLFDQAMRLEASFVRCKSGRGELGGASAMMTAAATHSKWMAKARKLTHKSTISGQRTLKPRMRSTGIKFKTAAENIALFDRYQLGRGSFKIRNASRCQFSTNAGKSIPAHSYASLAQTVIAGWMKSSGHKKNLLNRRMQLTGAGLAFDARAPYCGKFYITQDYAG